MHANFERYFIGIEPDPQIGAEITAFKILLQEHFGSKHALRSPPHITLVPPFECSRDDLHVIQTQLRAFVTDQEPFVIGLRDFGAFPPRVLYAKVEENRHLIHLQSDLSWLLELGQVIRQEARPFHPHLTIAHRDLRAADFPAAWGLFSGKQYEREFPCREISLFRHESTGWVVKEKFVFGG